MIYYKNICVMLAILICKYLAGCSSNTLKYDPNEKVLNGIIIEKRNPDTKIMEEKMKNKRSNDYINAIMMYGISGAIMVKLGFPLDDREIQPNPIEYTVQSDNRTYHIKSMYPHFNKGDCVRIFLSSDNTKYPPRISLNGNCDKVIEKQRKDLKNDEQY